MSEQQELRLSREAFQREIERHKQMIFEILTHLSPDSESTEDVRIWKKKINEAWAFIGVKRGSENEI